ncbi:MAG: SusD/RagB family nutrient-binding outer membrane lipoprotein, partial [Bacteroidales bacterium]|nr:SusD/RagB family nutrient-binding outer membrane lipoprotein [Bacteroidales bacterium]
MNEIEMNYFFTAAELGLSDGNPRGNRYLNWRTNIGMCAHATQQLQYPGTGLLCTGDKYIDNDPEVDNAPFEYWIQDVGRNTAEILKQTGTG